MSTRVLLVSVLLLAMCLCFQDCAANRWHPNKGYVPLCCTRVSPADVSEQIIGTFTTQEASGRCVEALIFPIEGGKVCVDPKADWVQTFLDKNKKP